MSRERQGSPVKWSGRRIHSIGTAASAGGDVWQRNRNVVSGVSAISPSSWGEMRLYCVEFQNGGLKNTVKPPIETL